MDRYQPESAAPHGRVFSFSISTTHSLTDRGIYAILQEAAIKIHRFEKLCPQSGGQEKIPQRMEQPPISHLPHCYCAFIEGFIIVLRMSMVSWALCFSIRDD